MKFKFLFILILVFLLVLTCIYGLCAGSYEVSIHKIYQILSHKLFKFDAINLTKTDFVVIYDIRLPRIITAIFTGFALSVAGCVYQACFRNPLVDPFILGASSGAAFGAALGIIFANAFFSVSLIAFICSISAVFLAYFLAKNGTQTPVVGLILSGVIIGSIFSALVSILKYISDDNALREITFWIMGGIYYASWDGLGKFTGIIFVISLVIFALSYRLNLLSLGDKDAQSLGISPEKNKILFILLATLLTSVSVANVGIIAWIGLMMPHIARLIIGADNRFVLICAGLMGAIYLEFCDTLARTISMSEIPVGIITSIVAAPFLLWLLRVRKKELSA